MKKEKILLGLDIGTNSCGWCVTDRNGKILKKQGKSLWGTRMFEAANDASDRRGHRSSRRRIARRRERLDLLQYLLGDEIYKVDKTFIQRLEESFYKIEDRASNNKYVLFNDIMTDASFYKEFPTTYHLRKNLIEVDQKADVRFIYLAIAHMFKKRGHFLNSNVGFKIGDTDKNILQNKVDLFSENINLFFNNISNDDIEEIKSFIDTKNIDFLILEKIYNDSNFTRNERKTKLNNLFNTSGDKNVKNLLIPFMLGGKLNLQKIEAFELDEKKEISFSDEQFIENIELLKAELNVYEEFFDALIIAKEIYDYFYLVKILKSDDGNISFLYDAMIKKYDEHNKDLKMLKNFIKNYCPNKYDECFKNIGEFNNYAKYIGKNKQNNKIVRCNRISKENFYKYLQNNILLVKVDDIEGNKIKEMILKRMDNSEFLSFIIGKENSVIPYQLNLVELELILNKQSKYHEFLNNVDDDGISIKDKIISILTFKIPYYIGPLNKNPEDVNPKHSWIVRTEEKIYPWNFNKVVDIDKTAEKFIKRMLNKCTYLRDCYCLPSNSLVFSKYNILSVINKIYINGAPLENAVKHHIIDELFAKKSKVTKTDILNYFKCMYGSTVKVTTSSLKPLEEINCNFTSFYEFSKIFGVKFVNDNKQLIDDLIGEIVIFEDKKVLEERLKKEAKYEVFRNNIKEICSLNFKGYARISDKLLTKLRSVNTNESILEIMENTNFNLQEIIFNKDYGFESLILDYNKNNKLDYTNAEDFIDNELYVSPIMKRPLLQAYKIIEEVEKILGQKIDEFYVECARTNLSEKRRSVTRKNKIKEHLLNSLKKDTSYVADIKSLLNLCNELPETAFRSEKYYLYFMQLGRCMYSLEPINFADLNKDELYDVDHIIPQALIKDDSINNKVLVKSDLNKRKSNIYPIPQEILNVNAKNFYAYLKKNDLIGNRKYDSLIKVRFSDADIEGFINRQLVVTNQAVSGLRKLLVEYKGIENSNIIYSKAENVSDFRKKFKLYKSRVANNFHHAHDAYLNIIVGQTVDKYFKKYIINQYDDIKFFNRSGITTNAIKIFDLNSSNDTVKKYWNEEKYEKVRKNIYNRFDILTTTRTYIGNELFKKITILKAKSGLIPTKENHAILSNTDKYGGLLNESFNYYSLVKVMKKNHYQFELIAMPKRFEDREEKYLESKQYNGFEIIIRKLKINTVFEMDKMKFCITGKSKDELYFKNLNERIFTEESIIIIKKIEKYIDLLNKKIDLQVDSDEIIISPSRTKENLKISITKDDIEFLYEKIKRLFMKDNYAFSNILKIAKNIYDFDINFLDMKNQIKILWELLNLLKCNERKSANLKDIGLTENAGTLKISKTLKPGMKIVYESITGFYRKVVWEYNEF